MKIDFATLAFGYNVKIGGGTPNWATSLGQGKEYRIHESSDVDDLIRGIIYNSVSLSNIKSKIGKGGKLSSGEDENSPILIGAFFKKVYVNNTLITNGNFILLITRDDSKSHAGRLRLKYGPSNTVIKNEYKYTNEMFWEQVKNQMNLTENACYFVYDISVKNQDELVFKTIIVNDKINQEYYDSKELHDSWQRLINSIEPSISYITDNHRSLIPGTNTLLYGVPGCGKSFTVDQEVKNLVSSNDFVRRVVFHPDYTNSDFIGQIMPKCEEDNKERKISYDFEPGPFASILKKAIDNQENNTVLIIEEINRGNAPAIFGELFQLLDRNDDGTSKYGVSHPALAKMLYDNSTELITLPPNLHIFATMNTSDQNVFTLDTAFQRRWQMKYIKNDFKKCSFSDVKIVGTNISWRAFAETVNDTLASVDNMGFTSCEDKGLGAYFSKEKEFHDPELFSQKVLKYLWDDAFKLNRHDFFKEDLTRLPILLDVFTDSEQSAEDALHRIIKDEVYEKMMEKQSFFEASSAEE